MKNYNGKILREIKEKELKAMGITDKALETNYNHIVHKSLYIDDNTNEIYEFVYDEYTGHWAKDTFVQWFNEIEGVY